VRSMTETGLEGCLRPCLSRQAATDMEVVHDSRASCTERNSAVDDICHSPLLRGNDNLNSSMAYKLLKSAGGRAGCTRVWKNCTPRMFGSSSASLVQESVESRVQLH
jgi:hypothetical protein